MKRWDMELPGPVRHMKCDAAGRVYLPGYPR
jgi:hypothetical protein